MKRRPIFLIPAFIGLLILSATALSATADQTQPKFEQPVLITSAGQSAEVQLASVLAKRASLDYALVKLAEPADLDQRKTLVLSIGASMKGLGAAGLDMAEEKTRVNGLIEAAESRQIPLLGFHLGGKARRGQLTDDLARELIPKVALMIVVKSGNYDGFFTNICNEHDIPLIEVERAADALQPFQAAFQ